MKLLLELQPILPNQPSPIRILDANTLQMRIHERRTVQIPQEHVLIRLRHLVSRQGHRLDRCGQDIDGALHLAVFHQHVRIDRQVFQRGEAPEWTDVSGRSRAGGDFQGVEGGARVAEQVRDGV